MPDKECGCGKKADADKKKTGEKGELSIEELDKVSGGYSPGRNKKKKSDPQHHHEDR